MKRTRRDKFDTRKKKRYLEALRGGSNRCAASSAAGVHRSTVARHRTRNDEFAEAETIAELEAAGAVENSLFRAAVVRGNVTAMIFYLKNRVPERWTDVRDEYVAKAARAQVELLMAAVVHAMYAAGANAEMLEKVSDELVRLEARQRTWSSS